MGNRSGALRRVTLVLVLLGTGATTAACEDYATRCKKDGGKIVATATAKGAVHRCMKDGKSIDKW